ncbi:MAG: sugar phosphate isomerase/epimerase [Thermodesulfobacteriota bacterium]|nr:sugar phosphate isomerase/epimerase [Thermodesulfobacteriota bacterium]
MIKTIYDVQLGGTARSVEDVEKIHSLGLQFVEIPITDPEKFSSLVRVYRDQKKKLGLYYLCHGPREGDPNDTEVLERDYIPKILDILPLMIKLDMNLLTIHLWLDPRFVKKEVIEFKIDLLKRVIDRATDNGIIICLENLSENAAHMVFPFSYLPLLNMTLDLGHAQLLTDINTSCGFMEQYPERIKHIHMHDNRGGDSYLDDLHLPPGEGIIDFKKIFDRLRGIGYKHTITLELTPLEIKNCLGYVKKLVTTS